MSEDKIIRQVKVSNDLFDIHAKTADYATTAGSAESAEKWDGHTFSEVENLIHGVVDTYVIPETKSSSTGYGTVVGATTTQVSTTVGTLKGLVSNPPTPNLSKSLDGGLLTNPLRVPTVVDTCVVVAPTTVP